MSDYIFVADARKKIYEHEIFKSLPIGAESVQEVQADGLSENDIRKKFFPCVPDVTKASDGFTVTLETEDVRKYILKKVHEAAAGLEKVKEEIASGQEGIVPFADLFLPFTNEYALRILNAAPGFVNSDLYSGRQTDLTTWLYGKLREADGNGNSTIQFRITQVFLWTY